MFCCAKVYILLLNTWVVVFGYTQQFLQVLMERAQKGGSSSITYTRITLPSLFINGIDEHDGYHFAITLPSFYLLSLCHHFAIILPAITLPSLCKQSDGKVIKMKKWTGWSDDLRSNMARACSKSFTETKVQVQNLEQLISLRWDLILLNTYTYLCILCVYCFLLCLQFRELFWSSIAYIHITLPSCSSMELPSLCHYFASKVKKKWKSEQGGAMINLPLLCKGTIKNTSLPWAKGHLNKEHKCNV